jgi:hypothetical protein
MLAQIGKRLHLDLHLHRALLEICRRSGFLFVVGHHRFSFTASPPQQQTELLRCRCLSALCQERS